MSCFTQVRTQLTDRQTLVDALSDLGYPLIPDAREVRGWQGQTRPAELVVGTGTSYDIGAQRNEGGAYDLVADWEMAHVPRDELVARVAQRYATLRVLATARKHGFTVAHQQVDEHGRVRLLLRRFA